METRKRLGRGVPSSIGVLGLWWIWTKWILDVIGLAGVPEDIGTIWGWLAAYGMHAAFLFALASILYWTFLGRPIWRATPSWLVWDKTERELRRIVFKAGDKWIATGYDVFASYGSWLQTDKKANEWTMSVANYIVKQSERECSASGCTLSVDAYDAMAKARAILDCLYQNELLRTSSPTNVESGYRTYSMTIPGERALARAQKRARKVLSVKP